MSALPVARGFSPLDEELALGRGAFSPQVVQSVVRLGTWLPFEQVPAALAFFSGVGIGTETARRLAERVGTTQVALETAAVARLERDQPAGPAGPAVQQVSADGALVPLVGGAWAEVKTVAIGTVETTTTAAGAREGHTRALSYFSRLTDVETFTRLALVELHRRGTATAGVVVAPMDGADWEQAFLDMHRPDAVRILDFPHALEHLGVAAQATFGPGTAEASAWLGVQAHTLKHGDPAAVLAALRALPVTAAPDPGAATAARDGTLGYLGKRWAQIQYAQFQAQGYPIGSGCVESANKLLVEARLKGAGMHWARPNVDGMLALRSLAAADRWEEAWPDLAAALRAHARRRRQACRPSPPPPSRPAPVRLSRTPCGVARPAQPPKVVNGRPTAAHPWKKHPLLARGRAHAKP